MHLCDGGGGNGRIVKVCKNFSEFFAEIFCDNLFCLYGGEGCKAIAQITEIRGDFLTQ